MNLLSNSELKVQENLRIKVCIALCDEAGDVINLVACVPWRKSKTLFDLKREFFDKFSEPLIL